MRAILNTGPGKLEMREVPAPEPGAGQVRIRTAFCAICATDLQMIAGWKRTGFPSIPGHEWAGVVDAIGPGVDPGLVGVRCVGENVLSDGGEVGFEHPGGYGEEFLTEEANVYPLPAAASYEAAALVEPLAVCVHALRRLGHQASPDEPVLVLGDGPIGLLLLMLLADLGCRNLLCVGGRKPRLALAGQLGATRVFDYHESRPRGRFPLIFEASGSPQAMETALDHVEHLGTVVLIGDYGAAKASFEWNALLHREATLVGSNASSGAWPEAVRLAVRLPLGRLVTHRFPPERFPEAFALMRSRDPSVMKILFGW